MPGKRNFALIGAGGYVAPRHMQAIKDTGNELVSALDIHDSVGTLDRYFPHTSFFTEFERFDRHAEKLRRLSEEKRIHYVSICSPNYLHDAHIRFALRMGAHAICEKPLVLNPWNLDALEQFEKEYGKKVYTVLQLRLHPALIELKKKIDADQSGKKYEVELVYITPRGPWYFNSWKGSIEKSGGVASNIGIHFFDMLSCIFGSVRESHVHLSDPKKMAGFLELEKARVKWFLSVDREDLDDKERENNKAYRSITINGEELEFSEGFADLHTQVYRDVLLGEGYGIKDIRPSIELVYEIRNAKINIDNQNNIHPRVLSIINKAKNNKANQNEVSIHPSAIVDQPASIGQGTKVWHFSHIMPGARLGNNCVVSQNCFIGSRAVIGNNVKLQNNVSVYDMVTLEDNVFVGPSAVFTNDMNPRAAYPKGGKWIATLVKKNASIGANATIVCGTTIGQSAFVGAGSVVCHDVPDFAVVVGVPARIIGWMCECGEKIKLENDFAVCSCGKKFKKHTKINEIDMA